MDFQFFVEKLEGSEEFKDFKKKNPKAYLCSGFFAFDIANAGKENTYHLDFLLKAEKKIMSFKLENGIELMENKSFGNEKFDLVEIPMNLSFEFKDFEAMIIERMEKEGIKNKIQKLLYSLQRVEGKDYLVGTVFITGFGLVQVNIDITNKAIEKFEKKSFMDFLKVVKKGDEEKK